MANVVPVGSLYKFVSHKRRVLSLYKRAQRHLESHCIRHGRATYCYERTLLRARFCLLNYSYQRLLYCLLPKFNIYKQYNLFYNNFKVASHSVCVNVSL